MIEESQERANAFQLEVELSEQERMRSLLRRAVGQAQRAVRRSHEVRRDLDSGLRRRRRG